MKLSHTPVLLCALLVATGCGKDDAPTININNVNNVAADGGADEGQATDTTQPGTDAGDTGGGGDSGPLPDMGPASQSVTTTSGDVEGVEQDGILSFKGIPYAAPPTGDLRFRPPIPHPGWTTSFDAGAFGESCPQRDANGANLGSEDCLSLNIWAPDGAQGLPVMFFIHGGGFVQGASSNPLYDGTKIAERDVVIVTINYRLGALGFLATDELAAESADDSAGNYGLRDQILALEWVRDNIAAFGGDADSVTIFGESAGGVSVCGHLGSPMSEDLFARGIIESGGGCGNYPSLRTGTLTTDPAVMIGAQFVAEAGCAGSADVPQCLRDLPALDTVTAEWALTTTGLGLPPFGLNIDGTVLPDQPIERFRDGSARDVPLMTGSNADEATIFTALTPVNSVIAYEAIVNAMFGATIGAQVLQIYPASDYARPKDAYNTVFSDVSFICPALRFAGIAAEGAQPAYTYHLTRTLPGAAGALGAFHGLELFYVFGTFESAPAYTPTADDFALSEAMMSAWVGFATTGTIPWPAHDRLAPSIRIFDTTLETVDVIRDGHCTELAAIGLVP